MSRLATTIYSLLHAATEDVNAGHLQQDDAADILEATLLPTLEGPPRDNPHPPRR